VVSAPPATPPTRSTRLALVDVLRGFAVAQMIVYHFIYDLNYFGWVTLRMTRDQPWVGWRTAIVTQFLLLVGVSLVLRTSYKPGFGDFIRRWAEVAAAALLVSAGSWLLFGPRFVWFGILHFIAVALLLSRPLVRLGAWNFALAALAFAAWLAYADPAFNATPANVIGFVTAKPRTEDYVPLFPWLAAVLAGICLGTLWQRAGWQVPAPLVPLDRRPPRLLRFLGTWALTVYLVHQPLMMGALALLRKAGL
jgi:uncharacterized membrane protein